jgi:hypothetical protein
MVSEDSTSYVDVSRLTLFRTEVALTLSMVSEDVAALLW